MVTLTNEDDNYNQDGGGNQKPDTINALGGDDIILTSTLGGSLVLGGDGNDRISNAFLWSQTVTESHPAQHRRTQAVTSGHRICPVRH